MRKESSENKKIAIKNRLACQDELTEPEKHELIRRLQQDISRLELKKIPSRSTLQRTMKKLDKAWLRTANETIVAEFKKS